METKNNVNFKILLGYTKNESEPIYLTGFKWECGWYWSGGYIGNKNLHCHFDGCFLKVPDYRGHPLGNFNTKNISNGCSIWEDLSFFLNQPRYQAKQWWRIKDLYKQFYALKAAAEVFQYGGHCSSHERSKKEINPDMAEKINDHIQDVIIPEIVKALGIKN